PVVPAHGAHPHLPAQGPPRHAEGLLAHRLGFHVKPLNVGRWITWGLFALVLFVAPRIWTSGLAQTMLTQMGIGVIACLAYN
ncbi:hypothetical protein, partial [Escherichia coli]|uniref:hypothetical protein n=1 Tax=Escherichia coli TaxID=562 RepID=UPI002000AC9E